MQKQLPGGPAERSHIYRQPFQIIAAKQAHSQLKIVKKEAIYEKKIQD